MSEVESDRVSTRDEWRVAYPDGKFEYFSSLREAHDWMTRYYPIEGSRLERRTVTERLSYEAWESSNADPNVYD